MAPQGPEHGETLSDPIEVFLPIKDRARFSVRSTMPFPTGEVLDPDFAVRKPRRPGHPRTYAGVDEVLLLIEVARTSLDYDRGEKSKVYARSGVAEYWIVDLTGDRVVVQREPRGDAFDEAACSAAATR